MKTILFGTIIEEYSIKAKSDTNYSVCSVTNTNGFQKSSDTFDKQVFSENLSTYKKVFRGSFAYNPSRINVGSIGCQDIDDCVLVSPLYNIFSINTNITSPEFVSYFFKSGYVKNYIRQNTQGTVRSNFKMSEMSKLHFPNITIKEQNLLLNEFRYIESIISKDKAQLDLLDELIKSRFVEMFGDIFSDKSKYPTIKISKVVIPKIERAKKSFNDDEEIKYVDISSIDNKKNAIVGYTEYLMKDAPSRAQQHIRKDDILISTVRPNLNNVAKVSHDYSNIVASSGFCILRVSKFEPNYLFALVSMQLFADYLSSLTTGANYPAVSDKDILNFEIPNAPIEEQIKFSKFVEQVDKLKSSVQKHLTTMQELFDKKMDEYFN